MMSEWFNSWSEVLRCPSDGASLSIVEKPYPSTTDAHGKLRCSSCEREYPVDHGIVRFISSPSGEDLDDEIKASEMKARDLEAPVAGMSDAKDIIYTPPILKALDPRPSDLVVDLGCGSGFTAMRYVHRVGRLVGLDFSMESLRLFRRRLSPELRERVLLVQADLCRPPLAKHVFDKAISAGVLEHVPTDEARRKAMISISELLRPGGQFTCTVYNWSLQKQFEGGAGIGDNTRKEGFHNSGIYYYNFDASEFRDMLDSAGMRVSKMHGLVVPFRGAGLLGRLTVPLNRLLAPTRFGLQRAQFLMAHARTIAS
jgi:SAM-dependent methyltransferase